MIIGKIVASLGGIIRHKTGSKSNRSYIKIAARAFIIDTPF